MPKKIVFRIFAIKVALVGLICEELLPDSFLAFLQFGITVWSQIELQILLGFFSSIIQFKHHFYDLLFGERLQVFL